jgi:hypothetical protein
MYYWTPKRIKELKAAGYKLHASPASLVKKSDQVISDHPATAVRCVHPDPGLKHQASSSKHQASSSKLIKQQAASFKPRG